MVAGVVMLTIAGALLALRLPCRCAGGEPREVCASCALGQRWDE